MEDCADIEELLCKLEDYSPGHPHCTTAKLKPPTTGAKATSHTTTRSTSYTMIKLTSNAMIKPVSHKMIKSTPMNQDPKKRIVIEINLSDDKSSMGSKCKLEKDPYVKPLKKQKGKEVVKSNFYHPQPAPKKKVVARVTKVHASLFSLNRELLRDA